MATVQIDEEELKKLKFALVFMTGQYGDVGKKLARSANKQKKAGGERLIRLNLAALAVVEKYSNQVDIENIIDSSDISWAAVSKLIR